SDGGHAAAEDDLLNAADPHPRQDRIADQQRVEASAAIDAQGRLAAADKDGIVAVSGLDDVGSLLAAEDVVARASDQGIVTRRAVESENAGDSLARQAVGACRGGTDAERSPAAIQALDRVEVGQLRSVESDGGYAAGEIELLHVGERDEG